MNEMSGVFCDTVWLNANIATMCGNGRVAAQYENGCIVEQDGKIAAIGEASMARRVVPRAVVDCEGRWIMPGLIDCHTNLAEPGAAHGISAGHLIDAALARVDALISEGVTTIEIKCGYGRDFDSEITQLECAHRIGKLRDVRIKSTYMGFDGGHKSADREPVQYVQFANGAVLHYTRANQLADCGAAFEAEAGLATARHAGGSSAARLRPASRLLQPDRLDLSGVERAFSLKQSGSVAVLQPSAFYFACEAHKPPVNLLRSCGVPVALSSDRYPDTSPSRSLRLAMNMGAGLLGLTVDECLRGVTINAAKALGIDDMHGSLEPGKVCDLSIFEVGSLDELVRSIGHTPLHSRVIAGRSV